MIKDILLPVTGTSGEKVATAAVTALASGCGARLSLAVPRGFPPPMATTS